jgi:wyosine [tRNA(Phe)-imidazoG37] synthetase (radical SAM superfamily)
MLNPPGCKHHSARLDPARKPCPKNTRRGPISGKRPARRHVYGPVPSRRLGFSLGVDILPFKTCSLNCVYCQLGPTPQKTGQRRRFFDQDEILSQVRAALARDRIIDFITFSGSGEPTLNSSLGRLIRRIKKMTSIPVAVLTNSTFLTRPSVRRALLAADVVVPSLDAATAASFQKVNRPLPSLKIAAVIAGLEKFRREFKGQIWLEVMLVRGINDVPGNIAALKRAVSRIKPDRVQLNTVVRPPAEKWARPLSRNALEKIRKELGKGTEVVAEFRKKRNSRAEADVKTAILSMVQRRPVTLKEMAVALGLSQRRLLGHLADLERWGRVLLFRHKGVLYYQPARRGG